jgi:hypothetical protein
LGVDTPIGEVANVCRSNVVQAVAVSISSQVDPERAISDIRALRGSLPMRAKLLIGGSGAPQNIAGVQSIKQFGELATWCRGEWGTSI